MIDKKYTWDLTQLYKSIEEYNLDIAEIVKIKDEILNYKTKVMDNAKTLLELIEKQEEISVKFRKAYSYVHLNSDLDTRDSNFQELMSKIMSLSSNISSSLSFIRPEIIQGSERLDNFYKEEPKLELYRHMLNSIVRMKPHILSEAEEKIMGSYSEINSASANTFGFLNNADIKFGNIKDENGEEVELTHGTYIKFLESKDVNVRKAAFERMYSVFKDHINTISSLLESNVKSQVINARLRNYDSARHAALSSANIDVKVYDNLIDSVNAFLPSLHKYLRIKKKLLGIDEMHFYDIYTPIIDDVDFDIKYDEAKEKVIDSLNIMGEDYIDIVNKIFNSRWIDVYEKPGKRSGAYSSGGYNTPPYILLNHQNNLNSMSTLTHEMGHSVHTYYSTKNQPSVYSSYSIFLAEIASTFNEILLNDYMLKNTKDKKKLAYIINDFIETFRGTVFRQTMFAEFERDIHKIIEGGGALSPDTLNNLYLDLNKKYFGDTIVYDEEIKYEWSRIPHFYYNFYVYQYATGLCAATIFAKRVGEEKPNALRDYKNFLKAGSSKDPIDVLKDSGIDMTDPDILKEGLEKFTELVDLFEKMTN